MLLQKSVEHDSRVRREARALCEAGHRVEVVHTPPSLPGPALAEEGFSLTTATLPRWRRLPLGVHRLAEAFNMARLVRRGRPDAVHAHDVAMLVPGYIAARLSRARLVYDSHELATGVPYRSRPLAPMVAAIERLIVPRCAAVLTVSDEISERLHERYSLASRPTVVRNLCDLPPPGAVAAPDLRRELGIGEAPLALHQGAVTAGRGCETLVRAMSGLGGAHLLFLGAEGPYAERLRALAASLRLSERVHFHPPAALASLLSYTAQADLGISLLEDTCENHRLTLPNKVFEYVAAGRPVMASNLPALERLVTSYSIGWTVDPSDLSQVEVGLRVGLAADGATRTRVKRAGAKLSWRREVRGLINLYAGLEAESPPPK